MKSIVLQNSTIVQPRLVRCAWLLILYAEKMFSKHLIFCASLRRMLQSHEKLLRSAIANWEAKNAGKSPEDAELKFATFPLTLQECLSAFSQLLKVERTAFISVHNHVTIIVDSAKGTTWDRKHTQ